MIKENKQTTRVGHCKADETDHEPECPNGDWDRQDVIDHIMRVADRHNAEEKERQKREDDHVDKHELYGSGWPR